MALPAIDRFLSLFRPKPLFIPPEVTRRQELDPSDYQSRREQYPALPLTGWDATSIQQAIEQHDSGEFQRTELLYHAMRREGLIASALDQRRAEVQRFPFTLRCPKDAPDELHYFAEVLARHWQHVLPDELRGEITERVLLFGFQICRIQWTWAGGQRQPRLIPYTHSSVSWRQDLWAYQALSERGLETVSNDGREWVIFSLGGTRPWLRGIIRALAFPFFALITGDDRWLSFNDKFAEPLKVRYTPRLLRESVEAQRLRDRDDRLRGGDVVLCPRDKDGEGYDFKYVQVDGQGYKTLAEQVARVDERVAILVLGHNLLQSVQGGSLAAMRAAQSILRAKAIADAKVLQTGFESISKVWARANFGEDPSEWPELHGALPESKSWSLVFDTSDPEDKQAAGVRAAQYAQGLATFCKAVGPERLNELPIDWIEAGKRAGIPMLAGEDSYSQDGDDDAELSAEEWVEPPANVKAAARAGAARRPSIGQAGCLRASKLRTSSTTGSVRVFAEAVTRRTRQRVGLSE